VDLILEVRPHLALRGVYRPFGIYRGLAARRLPDKLLTVFGERDKRRERLTARHARALGARYDGGSARLHDRRRGIRRAEIDSDYFCHGFLHLLACFRKQRTENRSQKKGKETNFFFCPLFSVLCSLFSDHCFSQSSLPPAVSAFR
jgi:hypothetical protein